MQGFVARHGLRVYALPVLIVLTVVVVLQPVTGRRHAASADVSPREEPVSVGVSTVFAIALILPLSRWV